MGRWPAIGLPESEFWQFSLLMAELQSLSQLLPSGGQPFLLFPQPGPDLFSLPALLFAVQFSQFLQPGLGIVMQSGDCNVIQFLGRSRIRSWACFFTSRVARSICPRICSAWSI